MDGGHGDTGIVVGQFRVRQLLVSNQGAAIGGLRLFVLAEVLLDIADPAVGSRRFPLRGNAREVLPGELIVELEHALQQGRVLPGNDVLHGRLIFVFVGPSERFGGDLAEQILKCPGRQEQIGFRARCSVAVRSCSVDSRSNARLVWK